MHLRRRRQLTTAGFAVVALALAACSSSSSSSGSSGTSTTPAAGSSSSSGTASGTIKAAGSTFQTNFQQSAISAFKSVDPNITVDYDPVGSGTGRSDLYSNTVLFAGSDSPVPAKEASEVPAGKTILYFPVQVGPIAIAYNLSGVTGLKLDATVLAGIFQGTIKTWDDPAIKALNPGANLPSTTITLAVRSDSSGTTANFSQYLVDAAGSAWKLGTASTITWPSTARAGDGGSAVAQIVKTTTGAIGYVDFSTATAAGLQAAPDQELGRRLRRAVQRVRGRGRVARHPEGRPDLPHGRRAGRDLLPDHLPVLGPGVLGAAQRDRRRPAQGLPGLPAQLDRPGSADPAQPRAAPGGHRLGGRRPAEQDHLVRVAYMIHTARTSEPS